MSTTPATSVHVPKVIKTELLRQRIGDARFERLALEVFGPALMPVKVAPAMLARTIDVLEGRVNGHAAAHAIPLVFRAWFAENPKTRARLIAWLHAKVDGNGRGEELNGSEMREVRKAVKARLNAPRKRGRPKGSRNRKVAR